jgi:hypothetical protein
VNQSFFVELAPACRVGNVLASAKFPKAASFFHLMVLLMPSRRIRFLPLLMLRDCRVAMAARWQLRRSTQSFGRTERLKIHLKQRVCG